MKKLIALFLTAVLFLPSAVAISHRKLTAIQQNQHRAMHEIVMLQRDENGEVVDGGLCTAYAVGPHTLLTAEHCNAKTDRVYIDPISRADVKADKAPSYEITARVFDNEDHMLLDIKGDNFKDEIYLSPNVRLPEQGERTYTWGNPAGIRDQYREGIVAGSEPYQFTDGDVNAVGPTMYIVQTVAIGGDSGSAVFSATDGAVIGIVTYGFNNGTMMGMFPIKFSGAQIEKALE